MALLMIDSSNQVFFDPEYDFEPTTKKTESAHRVRSGKEFAYLWGNQVGFKMGVRFVDSSFQCTVNSWYRANTDLLFVEYEAASPIAWHVRLVNKSAPIDRRIKPYRDQFEGVIELETYSTTLQSCTIEPIPTGDYGSIADAVSSSYNYGSIADAVTNCPHDLGGL